MLSLLDLDLEYREIRLALAPQKPTHDTERSM